MAEKPMTPHERAAGIVRQVRAADNGFLHRLIAEAIQAATKDLETLFATQAQRADEAELKVSTLQSKLAEFEFDNGGILSSLAEQTKRADAALAQAAELRRALRDIHGIATRELAEPTNNDTAVLVSICTAVEAALPVGCDHERI